MSWDYPANTSGSIARAVAGLREALEHERIPLRLHTGAEIAMTSAVHLTDGELVALRLGGPDGTFLLVECPLVPSAAGFEQVLATLRRRGHEILLAHPERCPAFQRDPGAYERLIAGGQLGQVTAGALVGRFGSLVQRLGDRLVREGLAHVVASDAHSAHRRRPSIRAELIASGFGEQADWLARAMPAALLSGGPLPAAPAMPQARRPALSRLLGR